MSNREGRRRGGRDAVDKIGWREKESRKGRECPDDYFHAKAGREITCSVFSV